MSPRLLNRMFVSFKTQSPPRDGPVEKNGGGYSGENSEGKIFKFCNYRI